MFCSKTTTKVVDVGFLIKNSQAGIFGIGEYTLLTKKK